MSRFVQDIFRFQVPVSDLALVAVGDSAEQLLHDVSGLFLREKLVLDDTIKKLAAEAELRDDIEVVVVLVELVDGDDVRVVLG